MCLVFILLFMTRDRDVHRPCFISTSMMNVEALKRSAQAKSGPGQRPIEFWCERSCSPEAAYGVSSNPKNHQPVGFQLLVFSFGLGWLLLSGSLR
jgi:hypothetical protein